MSTINKLALAETALSKRDTHTAKALLNELLEADSKHVLALVHMLTIAISERDVMLCNKWRSHLSERPDVTFAHLEHLTQIAIQFDLLQHSLFFAKLAYSRWPKNTKVLMLLSQSARECRANETALDTLNAWQQVDENNPIVYYRLGQHYAGLGLLQDSQKALSKAIELAPTYAAAYADIAKSPLSEQKLNDLILQAAQWLEKVSHPLDKARFHYALADLYNQQGEYTLAWDAAERANAYKAQTCRFDAVQLETHIELVEKLANYCQDVGVKNNSSEQPVLIVGMPRSGTTLAEQLVASSGHFYPGGETPILAKVCHGLLSTFSKVQRITENDLQVAANEYLSYFAQFENYNGGDVIDKVPTNYVYVPLFVKLFPNGKIIDVNRNYHDIAVSIFFNHFGPAFAYTNAIKDINCVYTHYEKCKQQWGIDDNDNIVSLSYESLVKRDEKALHRLAALLNVAFDVTTDDFVKAKNLVETPSLWQVRKGLNSGSINRYQRYSGYLSYVGAK